MIGRLVRFFFLFFGSLALVWILAIGPEGELFNKKPKDDGRRRSQQQESALAASNEGSADDPGRRQSESRSAPNDNNPPRDRAPSGGPTGGNDIALRSLKIPVREELGDGSGISVMKYELFIGSCEEKITRHMNARDVSIKIHNKKVGPDDRVLANIRGSHSVISFASAPDPHAGFQGAEIEGMTFQNDVLVEYLDLSGKVITTLKTDHLEMSDDHFFVPNRAVIEQEGLYLAGDELTYDKSQGIFRLERNVVLRGTRFRLPESDVNLNPLDVAKAADTAAAIDDSEKTITSDGPFVYQPAEEIKEIKGDDAAKKKTTNADDSLDPMGSLSGGLVTFEKNVIGLQQDSTLHCERLEVTLEKVVPVTPTTETELVDNGAVSPDEPKATGSDQGELTVTHLVAFGSPGRRAELVDPRLTMLAERLLMDKSDEGQRITLIGQPDVLDAKFGAGTDASAITVHCRQQMQILPISRAHVLEILGPDHPAIETLADNSTFTLLELRDQAMLKIANEDPAKEMALDAESIDLLLEEVAKAKPTSDAGQGESGDAESMARSTMRIVQLIATEDAVGTLAAGTFRGNRILVSPVDDSFQFNVTPNPHVELVKDRAGTLTEVDIFSNDGELSYIPPAERSNPAELNFTGRTEMTVKEAGAISTFLAARDSVTIEVAPEGEDPLQSLVAVGEVSFDSPMKNASGNGDRLVLKPGKNGSQSVFLTGKLASASIGTPGEAPRVVDAEEIEYDEASGELIARRSVTAEMADIMGTGGEKPGSIKSDYLRVVTSSVNGSAEESVDLQARGSVAFVDEGQGIVTRSNELFYNSFDGVARLVGTTGQPAHIDRLADATKPNQASVTIDGPTLLLYPADSSLVCPTDGVVQLNQPKTATKNPTEITAQSVGPVVYRDDRLVLSEDVLVVFKEDGVEQRALWCDVATAFFQTREDGAPRGDGSMGNPTAIDRLFAEGRVHIVQKQPKPLVGEGNTLEWWIREEGETMLLKGLQPRAWVEGLLAANDIRYEADSFLLHTASEDYEVENGVFVNTTLAKEN